MSAEGKSGLSRHVHVTAAALVAGLLAGYAAWSALLVKPGGREADHDGSPAAMPHVQTDVPGVGPSGGNSPGTRPASDEDNGPPAGGLRERSATPWRVPAAASRQIIEIALRPVAQPGSRSLMPDMPPPPATASCEVVLEGGGPVRVFDRSGRERPCRLEPVEGDDAFELVFEAEPGLPGADPARDDARDDGPFEVYYPASGGKELARDEGEGGVSLTVYPAPREQIDTITYPGSAAAFVRRTKPLAPAKRRLQINDCTIPFDRHDNYVAAYRAWIACAREGQYMFALDADDRAFIVVDGRQVLVGGNRSLPPRPFQFRRLARMEAGLHALTFYHMQRKAALRSRFAWRPPGTGKIRVVPPSVFVSHLPARAVALERRDEPESSAFFSAEVKRRLVVNRRVPVTRYRLVASGPKGPGGAEGPRWVWREGDRILGAGDRLDLHVSGLKMPGAGVDPWRDITLALEGPAGEVSSYTRRLRPRAPDPLEDEGVGFQLRAASVPTFVYPHEPFEVHVHVVNDSAEAVELEAIEVRKGRSDRATLSRGLGRFELPGVPEDKRDVIARRMYRIVRRFGPGECSGLKRVTYLVGPPGAPAVPLTIDVLGSRERWERGLSAEGGGLVVGASRTAPEETGNVLVPPRVTRALFVLPFDSEGELRKWGMVGSVSLRGGSGKSLLYGDTLASPGAAGGEGLAPRMRKSLEAKGIALEAAAPPNDAYPIHAACAGADREFARERWGTIYISPGLADCRAGTPPEEFARGVDFLIDRASVLAPQARLVVIGPPPEWTREDVSARYADAAREMVVRHRVAYVDLFSLVKSLEAPGADGREPGPDDGARFPYPLGVAMDAIAAEALSR